MDNPDFRLAEGGLCVESCSRKMSTPRIACLCHYNYNQVMYVGNWSIRRTLLFGAGVKFGIILKVSENGNKIAAE